MVMGAVGGAAAAAGTVAGALGLTKNEKAKLVVVGDNTPDGAQSIECMFNPTSYSMTQDVTVKWNRAPGAREGGTPEYTGRGPMKLTMELFFDDFASKSGDVTPKITTLLDWTRPTKKSTEPGKAPCPPKVKFEWGNPQLKDFAGFLRSVTVNYTVFRKDGTPVQAKVGVTIEGEGEAVPGQNPTSHAMNSSRVRTILDGDSLQSIAFEELGTPGAWRAIAELNRIDDPLRLVPGTTLLVPSAADAAKLG
jgi:nucleoid-associated protein YgaU